MSLRIFRYTHGMPTHCGKQHTSLIGGVRRDTLYLGDWAVQNVYWYRDDKSGGLYGRLFRFVYDRKGT